MAKIDINPFLRDYVYVKYTSEGKIDATLLRDKDYVMLNKIGDNSVRIPVIKDDWYMKLKGSNEFIMVFKIAKLLEYDKDIFEMDRNSFPEFSTATYYRCVSSLIDAKFIAKTDSKGKFYINPHFMFKGSVEKLVKKVLADYKKDTKWWKYQNSNVSNNNRIAEFESRVGDGGNIPNDKI